eukprot:c17132_g1_i1.p1 GENE.c17132_g1_i1~~c17132_g1_i1.p1  ORF type:complete len:101 (-),score=18.85 c17132_g1_i1:85-387(-)
MSSLPPAPRDRSTILVIINRHCCIRVWLRYAGCNSEEISLTRWMRKLESTAPCLLALVESLGSSWSAEREATDFKEELVGRGAGVGVMGGANKQKKRILG